MADHVADQEPDKIEPGQSETRSHDLGPAEDGAAASKRMAGTVDGDHLNPVRTASTFTPTSTGSEWTASDARGPLNAAGDPIATHGDGLPLSGDESIVEPSPTGPAMDATTEAAASPTAARPGARSYWPIAAGIVVGAIIGAGSAMVYTGSSGSDADQKIAALSARVDSLQARPDLQPSIDALKRSVAGLGEKVGSLQHAVGTSPEADKAQGASPVQAFDPAPLAQKIQALQSGLDELKARSAADAGLGDKITALSGAIDGLKTQDEAAKANVASLGAEQKALAAKVTNAPALAVVADSLVSRIDRGLAYADQVDALAAIGADPARIAVLKENAGKGVPSAKALAESFEPLADPIVATEHRAAAPNASFADKLKAGLFGMVSIRAVGDTTGDGIAAKVAAIQADLAHDDVSGAYAVWTALPSAAKGKSEAWGALAKTHAEAMDAARALQTQAIADLGAKKS